MFLWLRDGSSKSFSKLIRSSNSKLKGGQRGKGEVIKEGEISKRWGKKYEEGYKQEVMSW